MISNIQIYKADLQKLIKTGNDLFHAIQYECYPSEFKKQLSEKDISDEEILKFIKSFPSFTQSYQSWYSEALTIIKLLLPDRVNNFISFYEKPKNRKEISVDNYVIEDYLQGLRVTRGWNDEVVKPSAAIPKFTQQLNILISVERRFESSLFDIKQLVQADLFDSELEKAKELAKNKFYRASGAITGVVLEKHLRQVVNNHGFVISKKNPTINDFNELLKQNEVIEIPQWRFIQHLADIRNLCDHDKKKEPSNIEIEDLIKGVEKITKTIF